MQSPSIHDLCDHPELTWLIAVLVVHTASSHVTSHSHKTATHFPISPVRLREKLVHLLIPSRPSRYMVRFACYFSQHHWSIAYANFYDVIIIIIIVSFMQVIYTHVPETNHVPREYIVAVILLLLFMVPLFLVPALALLYFHVSTFRSMCAVPTMAVFCSSLTSWCPGMLLTCFLYDFEVVPVAPITTGINCCYYNYYYHHYSTNKT